jgi:hypothetical protein
MCKKVYPSENAKRQDSDPVGETVRDKVTIFSLSAEITLPI